jgi:flagellar hook assembly protein FlgD
VTVKIFNTLGETVRTLADKDFAAGTHAVRWNAQNERGEIVPSGMYFYQLVTPSFTETKRMILAK